MKLIFMQLFDIFLGSCPFFAYNKLQVFQHQIDKQTNKMVEHFGF